MQYAWKAKKYIQNFKIQRLTGNDRFETPSVDGEIILK